MSQYSNAKLTSDVVFVYIYICCYTVQNMTAQLICTSACDDCLEPAAAASTNLQAGIESADVTVASPCRTRNDHLEPGIASANLQAGVKLADVTVASSRRNNRGRCQEPDVMSTGIGNSLQCVSQQQPLQVACRRNVPRNKTRRFSAQWYIPTSRSRSVYCLCRKPYSGIAMLQCDDCEEWYHCKCIGIDENICKNNADNEITFYCGYRHCRKSCFSLTVKNNPILVKHTNSCSCIVTACEPSSAVNEPVQCVMSAPEESCINECDIDLCSDLNHTTITSNLNSTHFPSNFNHNTELQQCTEPIDKHTHDLPAKAEFYNTDLNSKCNHNNSNEQSVGEYEKHLQADTDFNNTELPSTLKHNISNEDLLPSLCTESILGCKLPDSDVYEQELPAEAEFNIEPGTLNSLRVPNQRYLVKGCWQNVFLPGLKQSNDICVLCFESHSISAENSRRARRLFFTSGYCNVPSCPVTFTLTMYNDTRVVVHYNGSIKHPLFGKWARPIRSTERRMLQDQFMYGRKPYSVYVDKLQSKTGNQLIAGNYDGIGKSRCVLRKIASESMHNLRIDPDVYKSLLALQGNVASETSSQYGIYEFLQSVSLVPVILHFWTENGVRLFHQLSCCCAVLLDATGSVVRKMPQFKRILYYELSVRNPTGIGSNIPVAGMIASEHTVAVISNFIRSFCEAEKRIFGFRKTVVPVVVKVDFSIALISAILLVFNKQDVRDYLEWSWDTVHASQPQTKKHTLVHVCLAHFVKCVKMQCLKLFKTGCQMVLYAVSLIASCDKLCHIAEIFTDLCIILCSPVQTADFTDSFNRLNSKIKTFDYRSKSCTTEPPVDAASDDAELVSISDARCDEDASLSRCTSSPYLTWATQLYASVSKKLTVLEHSDFPANRFYNVPILEQILKLYMPTIPLWTGVLVPVCVNPCTKTCRHTVPANVTFPRTTGSQEQRFSVLKQLMLGGKSTLRLDEFTHILKNLYTATEKEFVISYLQRRRKQTPKVTQTPVHEQWAKKRKLAKSDRNPQLGKYQQAASNGIRNLNSKAPLSKPHNASAHIISRFCPSVNLGNTCWFNATIQAIHKSHAGNFIIHCYERYVVIDSSDERECADQALLTHLGEIFKFMSLQPPATIPVQLISNFFQAYARFFPHRCISVQRQFDVHEFLTDVVFSCLSRHGYCCKVMQQVICNTCGHSSNTSREEECPSIILSMSDHVAHNSTVQELLDAYCHGTVVSAVCDSTDCFGRVCDKLLSYSFTQLPETIFILLKKYHSQAPTVLKNNVNIKLNETIHIQLVRSESHTYTDCAYSLCSIVSHFGITRDSGHYNAGVLTRSDDSDTLSLVVCDDKLVTYHVASTSVSGIVCDSAGIADNAIVLIYNKLHVPNKTITPVLYALKKSLGLATLLNDISCPNSVQTIQRCELARGILSGQHSQHLMNRLATVTDIEVTDIDTCRAFVTALLDYLTWHDDIKCNTFYINSVQFDSEQLLCIGSEIKLFVDANGSLSAQSVINALSGSTVPGCRHWISFSPTLIVECHNVDNLLPSLDLSSCIQHVCPQFNVVYNFSGALCPSGASVIYVAEPHAVKTSTCIVMYNLVTDQPCTYMPTHCTTPFTAVNNLVGLIDPSLTVPKLAHSERVIYGHVFSDVEWNIILSCQWFNDKIIDTYMKVLSNKSRDKILAYSCTWFSTFFHKQDSSKPKVSVGLHEVNVVWFSKSGSPKYDFVIIPASLLNAHFVVVVIDFQASVIHMCDAMCGTHVNIIQQVSKFICLAYYLATGKTMNVSQKFQFSNYCSWDLQFPRQLDTHNCGAYICIIAKCIIQNKALRFKAIESLRKTVRYELFNNTLV
jgi:Ubiquitin carboxyl-terminal hydrolase/Ulp1 protease family, C-terminal catalytic domain